ncbi:MAG: type II and III secretion system protein family protein [Alphaproteobacteria bacterium]|nr:type II and III secretion system protein family protein [Alphaproteobacteria bacterium]
MTLRLPLGRMFLHAATAVAVAAPVLLADPPPAAAQGRPGLTLRDDVHAGDLVVAVNKSQVVRLDQPFRELSVGNPQIADVLPLTNRSVYVLGKALGTTNLSVYGPRKELLAVLDLVVGHDVGGIKTRLNDLMPGEPIEVRAVNDSVVLSGRVSSPQIAGRAAQVAERFAPGKVTNLLEVNGSQQVMLAVRIAEVSRSVARELGIKPSFILGGEDFFAFDTLDTLDLNRFATALGHWTTPFVTLDLLLDALEEKGVVKILAEPNLVAMSGDTANFLAGGEFPVPVARNTDDDGDVTITIEFKQFGVSLAFTPTVVGRDLINLVVSPEVSQIDRQNAVTLSGFMIPGLSTRRATTTVELRDGQSFAIAGLLQSDFSDQVRQLPGIGDVPVLGALFRSSEFQRRESELVIIVSPRLVRPVESNMLAAPTDGFLPPSDLDLFLMGRVEAPASAMARPVSARRALGPQGGGIEGQYGHIVK